MNNIVVIIDGNSLINRAYYAMQRPMITKDGIYTQGIYGFINMLNKIEQDYEPSYITVAFDLKAPTFRHLEYDGYKAGRKPMPMELAMEMPILKDVLHAMNIKTMELEGFEADDILGTVSRLAEGEGLSPLIITGDRDALQLASDKTRVLITKKGISEFEIYDDKTMQEKYGLTPTQFIDLKGLMGDSSDNIPGIPGVGEKTGLALLAQFGSIENMLEHTDEIAKKGLRAKVEENAQLAVMSKRLATINRYVPIDFEFADIEVCEPNYDELVELYTKLEFNSFLKRLKVSPKAETIEKAEAKVEKVVVDSEQPLRLALLGTSPLGEERDSGTGVSSMQGEKLSASTVYLKVIGEKSHVEKPKIKAIFLMAVGEPLRLAELGTSPLGEAGTPKAYYIKVADGLASGVSLDKVIEVLNEANLTFIGHDIKDDIYALMSYGLTNFTVGFDTKVAEYVLDAAKSKYELPAMALEKLHVALPSYEEFVSEGTEQMDMLAMLSDTVDKDIDYYALTASVVEKLMEVQKEQIDSQGLEEVLYNIELPLIEVLAAMEVAGVCVEPEFLDEFGTELKGKIDELAAAIYESAGQEFNINSPAQLGEILFEKLGLPSGKKTKRGYSTSADVLEKIKDKHEIVPLILEYRNLAKLNSTYVEGMKPLIGEDKKIRAHFQQTIVATGRLSCTEPNLQNIPVRQELGRMLRKAFTASPGHTLVGADYSQIELRVLAHLSGDEALIEAFNNGEDIHKTTASRVLGIPKDEVTPADRSRAKAVNFGVIYGMSGFGLSEELHITRKEAENYIKAYFEKHARVKQYMDEQIEHCRKEGYTLTMTGRKRMIHEINASAYMVRQLGERLAMNSPIQGSAADIIKLAMLKVYADLKENHPNSKLILQVHDELIIDADDSELEDIKKLLVSDMESAVELSVKMIAELNTGHTWYELK